MDDTGTLIFNKTANRWRVVYVFRQSVDLKAGDLLAACLDQKWVVTRIEQGPSGYYSAVDGVLLRNGLTVKLA